MGEDARPWEGLGGLGRAWFSADEILDMRNVRTVQMRALVVW